MKTWLRSSLALSVVLLVELNAVAENLYVRPNATGASSGLDWIDAWTSFEQIAWGDGAGKLGAGDTLWIAGGTYGSLWIKGNGTSQSRIYIKRARAADPQCTSAKGWQAAYDSQVVIYHGSIVFYGTGSTRGDYVTIDGQVPGGIKTTQVGRTEGSGAEFGYAADYVELKYIEFEGPGMNTILTGGARGVDATPWDSSMTRMTGLVVSHCIIHDGDAGGYSMLCNNETWEYNVIYNIGAGNSAVYHPNGVYFVSAQNPTLRYNVCYNVIGEGFFFTAGDSQGVKIYGNVFYDSFKAIVCHYDYSNDGFRVYNNTFYNIENATFDGRAKFSNSYFYNNILYNTYGVNFGSILHDYNWTSGTTTEPNGVSGGSANPFVNLGVRDFRITSAVSSQSPRNKGTNLGAPYNVDRDGHTRGNDGAWDMGAYEYDSGVSDTTPPIIRDVGARNIGSTEATVAWTTDEASSSGVTYGVTSSYGSGATNASLVTSHACNVTSLAANTLYYVRVYSTDAAGNRAGSAEFTFRTTAPDTSEPVISNVRVSGVTSSGVAISWSTDENATSAVDYGSTTGYGWSASKDVSVTSHSIALTNLAADMEYHFRVRSMDGAGNMGTSGDFAFRTLAHDTAAPSVTLTAPHAGATVSNQLVLSATAVDNAGGSGVTGVEFCLDGSVVGEGTTTDYRVYSLRWESTGTANGMHVVQAVARDAEGNEGRSAEVSVTVQNTGHDLRAGLVGHWTFNEEAGTTAGDSSLGGNSGTLLEGVRWARGVLQGACSFDGVNDYVRVGSSTALELSGAGTMAAWVALESKGAWQVVLEKTMQEGTHSFPFSAYDLFVEASDGGTFQARTAVSGTDGRRSYAYGNTALNYGSWYHLAGTYDGANLRLYVNGVQDATTAFSGLLRQTGQPLYIGRNSGGGDVLKGLVDDVRVYNRALSAGEVEALYKAGTPSAPKGVRLVQN